MNKKIKFIIASFTCLAVLCVGKVGYLQTIQKDFLLTRAEKQRANPVPIDAKRGDILTSDGATLATSVPTYNIYSDTRYIKDIEQAAKSVSDFFKLDYQETLDKINSRYYIELVKGVSKSDIDEYVKSKPKGIGFYETTTRVYPNGGLMGNALGFIGAEGNGLAGVEQSLNKYLSGTQGVNNSERDKNGNTISYNPKDIVNPINGGDATLTVNYDIQYQMEKQIKEAVDTHEAKSGFAISINPKTGAVLGLAEYPTLDPNKYKDFDKSTYKTQAVSMVYEPGSTFKPVTVGIAGALGVVDIEKDIFHDGGSIYVGNHRIGNWGKKAFGSQTAREILMNSSNVGTVQIANKIPSDEFDNYLRKLGFGKKTGIELPGEQNSIMFSKEQLKNNVNKATNSFGQGMAVTPIQLLKSWAILINGGHNINPHILSNVINEDGKLVYSSIDKTSDQEQVIPADVSEKLKKMLQAVVDEGTGKRAQIPGYAVGGKTGTAQVAENGRYLPDKYKVSFTGFAPVEDPEILTVVMLDSPTGKASGGVMCAPYAKNIMEYSLNRLGIQPSFENNGSGNNEDSNGLEVTIDNYMYRLKSYVTQNPPSIPYEFDGDGDVITKQHYVSDEGKIKVVFSTDKVVKDDYIIMPNVVGMTPNEFISMFKGVDQNILINGDLKKPVSVQESKAGSKFNYKDNKIILWTE